MPPRRGQCCWRPCHANVSLARIRLSGKMAHDDLVCPPSVPACDHPARRLAVYAFHAQLSRRRRSACGARSEDVDPPHYGVELTDRAAIAAAVFDGQNQYEISDRKLVNEAKVSHHTLAGLKEGK